MLQSNREFPSRKMITPLKDLGGLSVRDFTGFSTAVPSPHNSRYHDISLLSAVWYPLHRFDSESLFCSSPIPLRTNMSLPVSPCSSPLRQFKQSNWSCLPSPPHPTYSSSAGYNALSYTHNQTRRSPLLQFQILGLMLARWNFKAPMAPPKGFELHLWKFMKKCPHDSVDARRCTITYTSSVTKLIWCTVQWKRVLLLQEVGVICNRKFCISL